MMIAEEVVTVFVSGYQIFRAIRLDEDAEDQSESVKFGYRLIGPQGQEYYLMRVTTRPEILVAMDMEKKVKAPPFAKRVFTDKGPEGLRIAK